MSQWTHTRGPNNTAVPSSSGWKDPITGEILVFISNFIVKRNNVIQNSISNIKFLDGGSLLLKQTNYGNVYLKLKGIY